MSPIRFVIKPVMEGDVLVWRRKLVIGFRAALIVWLYRRMDWKDRATVEIWMSHFAVVDK